MNWITFKAFLCCMVNFASIVHFDLVIMKIMSDFRRIERATAKNETKERNKRTIKICSAVQW